MPVERHQGISGPTLVFVTTTVKDWLPVFSMRLAADALTEQLEESTRVMNVSVMGYAIMPSHIHMMIGLEEYNHLSKFMQSFKSLSSRRIQKLELGRIRSTLYIDGKFVLWKRRFDDLIIYSQEQFKTKLEYIHNNPVRAGLADTATDWEYSSACDWLEGVDGQIPVEKNYNWT